MPDNFEEFERQMEGVGDDQHTKWRHVEGEAAHCIFRSIEHALTHAMIDIHRSVGEGFEPTGMYMKPDGQSLTIAVVGTDVYMKMQYPIDRVNEAREHLRQLGIIDPGEPCGP